VLINKTKIYIFKTLILIFSALLVVSCGGGGGEKKNEDDGQSGSLSFSETSFNFEAFENSEVSVQKEIRVNVTSKILKEITGGKKVYFIVSNSNPNIADMYTQVLANSGSLIIAPKPTFDLPIGEHKSTVSIRGCYDANCNNEFGKGTVFFKYNVVELPSYAEGIVTLQDGGTGEYLIDFKNMTLTDSEWDVEVLNTTPNSPELTVRGKSISGNSARIRLAANGLLCGRYLANVLIKINTAQGLNTTVTLPMQYEVTSTTPRVDNIFPKVQFIGKNISFTAKGCGFGKFTQDQISLSGIVVKSTNVRNDFEIEIIAEPILTKGKISISLDDSTASHEDSYVVIKPNYVYPHQSISNDDETPSIINFDQFNETIFLQHYSTQKWTAYTYNSVEWIPKDLEFLEQFAKHEDIKDIKISANGEQLYISTLENLISVDIATKTLVKTDIFKSRFDRISQFATLNNDLTLIPSNRNFLHLLNNKTSEQKKLGVEIAKNYGKSAHPRIAISKDRTIAFMSYSTRDNSSHRSKLFRYSTVDNQLKDIAFEELAYVIEAGIYMNQNGERNIIYYVDPEGESNLGVFNNHGENLVSIPLTITIDNLVAMFSSRVAITNDGKTIYALYQNGRGSHSDKYLISYALSVDGKSLNKIDEKILGTEFSFNFFLMNLTPNENSLIFSGHEKIIVPLN
jgi:hypothetical protein